MGQIGYLPSGQLLPPKSESRSEVDSMHPRVRGELKIIREFLIQRAAHLAQPAAPPRVVSKGSGSGQEIERLLADR